MGKNHKHPISPFRKRLGFIHPYNFDEVRYLSTERGIKEKTSLKRERRKKL